MGNTKGDDALSKEQKATLYKELGIWEMGYTIGILNYSITIFALARFPQYFWIVHMVKAFVYLPWRFIRFLERGWEWYMIEFCYLNTYLTVVCCILSFLRVFVGVDNPLHPYNHALLRVGFSFANGALMWAVVMFNNKLVFHDVDNTCSVYIHLSPALLFWSLRWGGGFGPALIEETWPGMFQVCPNMMAADVALDSLGKMLWQGSSSCAGSVGHFMLYPALVWFVGWCVPYSLLVFWFFADYLARNKKSNVYAETVEATDGVRKLMTSNLPKWSWPAAHMFQHFVFTMVCGAFTMLLWDSFVMHTLVLSGIILYMIHNGSVFTFRVVAAKHVTGLLQKTAQEGSTDYQPVRQA
ncbi:unnamed protein product [Polarella glacialis]|uniref:Glycerophosphocholine acyltransferase 1 n=1 Tax=Polarella glacialis TaxID=89957 RepID=A0A813FHW6_POLGL|nr:unnamed protein product [Polarella glacialis]